MKTKKQYDNIMNKIALEFSDYMWYWYCIDELEEMRVAPSFHSKHIILIWDNFRWIEEMVFVLCEKVPFDLVFDWYDDNLDQTTKWEKWITLIQYRKQKIPPR